MSGTAGFKSIQYICSSRLNQFNALVDSSIREFAPSSLPSACIHWVSALEGDTKVCIGFTLGPRHSIERPTAVILLVPNALGNFFLSLMEFFSGLFHLPKFHLFQKHTNMLVKGHLSMTWATKVFPLRPSHQFEDISSSISNPKVLKFSPISCHDPTKCFHVDKSSQI